jgi:hypothetical protein
VDLKVIEDERHAAIENSHVTVIMGAPLASRNGGGCANNEQETISGAISSLSLFAGAFSNRAMGNPFSRALTESFVCPKEELLLRARRQ